MTLFKSFFFRKFAVLATFLALALGSSAQKLAEFNLNSFDGWNYTRAGVTLSSDYICGNKVNLYGKYKLESPQFSVKGVKYVKAQVRIVVKDYAQAKYSITKASPTLELIDGQGATLASVRHAYAEPIYQQEFVEYIAVPEGAQVLQMRISAPLADVNSTGAVHEIILTASETEGKVAGDVNGDGVRDVSDVTALINMILAVDVMRGEADIDGNGTVDVSDVTALINMVLS